MPSQAVGLLLGHPNPERRAVLHTGCSENVGGRNTRTTQEALVCSRPMGRHSFIQSADLAIWGLVSFEPSSPITAEFPQDYNSAMTSCTETVQHSSWHKIYLQSLPSDPYNSHRIPILSLCGRRQKGDRSLNCRSRSRGPYRC